jgi:Ca2+-binding EF-hand superfamily protein
MLSRLIKAILLVLIAVVPLVQKAEAQHLTVDAFLHQWDTDHDGTLSLDEIKKAAIARFEALDRKRKGRLSRNRLTGVLTFQQFREADKDKNRRLDQEEFLSVVEKLFQAADQDHDGTLDRKELRSFRGRALLRLFAVWQGPSWID